MRDAPNDPAPRRAPRMLRSIYDRTIAYAGHRHALRVLALVSFAESSVFPVPPDALMIPMILVRPDRAFVIAAVAVGASVAGGLAGYAIGALAFETLGRPILELLGKSGAMAEFAAAFNDAGFWAVLVAGLTPIPYKVVTIMSGWTGMPLATFVATSVLARGIRFLVVAWLVQRYGAPVRAFIEQRLGIVFTVAVVMLIAGFVAVRLL
jgi:membrane protein YqaA with SNARE-associated domain